MLKELLTTAHIKIFLAIIDNFTYEQCVKTDSTDLQSCSIYRGYTDELNALSADTWEEDLSCELKFVAGNYQPTLKNNPHTATCFK